jgi:hypothetical protein
MFFSRYIQEKIMAKPTQTDLKKKEDFKQSLIKTIGGTEALSAYNKNTEAMLLVMSTLQLTDKKICSMMRSNVRKSWMMSPIRLLKLEMTRIPDMNPDTLTKWLWLCVCCKDKFKLPDVQTDHICGEHQLKTLSDIEPFTRSIMDVKLDDMQILCKNCHEIKTYAERSGISFDEATIEKAIILWMKTFSIDEQKILLTLCGYVCNNNKNRRESYKKYLTNNC